MKRGVILIACGHPYYGKMAAGLAASIRYSDKELPLVVYHTADSMSHLSKGEKALFTEMRELKAEDYMQVDKPNYVGLKTKLYELSPFEETLYLDVDMLWHSKHSVTELMDSLADVEFTMINEGFYNFAENHGETSGQYTYWAQVTKIKNAYANRIDVATANLYQQRSELIYFKRSKMNRRFFNLVKKVYANPLVEVDNFAGVVPDEFAFNVAGAILQHYPHKVKYCPVYWDYIHKKLRLQDHQILSNFFASSIGGIYKGKTQEAFYNNQVKFFYNNLKLQHPYQMKAKNTFLPSRQEI